MVKIEGPQTIKEQFERYLKEYDNYDFFFIHYKYTTNMARMAISREEKGDRGIRRRAADLLKKKRTCWLSPATTRRRARCMATRGIRSRDDPFGDERL